jgi:hypothetical protein
VYGLLSANLRDAVMVRTAGLEPAFPRLQDGRCSTGQVFQFSYVRISYLGFGLTPESDGANILLGRSRSYASQ